jgi:hypothetical protein
MLLSNIRLLTIVVSWEVLSFLEPVLWIRMFLDTDLPSSSKNSKENLDFYRLVTSLWLSSLKNDENVPSKIIFYWHLEGHWRKESDPDPKVSGPNPRIRIRAKMSRIHNTALNASTGRLLFFLASERLIFQPPNFILCFCNWEFGLFLNRTWYECVCYVGIMGFSVSKGENWRFLAEHWTCCPLSSLG